MNDSLILERVEANLMRLRLPRISQILQSVIEIVEEKSKSYLTFLDELLEQEVEENRRQQAGKQEKGGRRQEMSPYVHRRVNPLDYLDNRLKIAHEFIRGSPKGGIFVG